MTGMSRRRVFFVPLLACACHTSRIVPLAPTESRELSGRTWVVLKGGERVALEAGHVLADSIVGTRRDGGRFAVSRDRVAYVEDRHLSAGRTLGLAGGIFVGLIVIVGALATAAGPGLPA